VILHTEVRITLFGTVSERLRLAWSMTTSQEAGRRMSLPQDFNGCAKQHLASSKGWERNAARSF
jgi:hypothetical protein